MSGTKRRQARRALAEGKREESIGVMVRSLRCCQSPCKGAWGGFSH